MVKWNQLSSSIQTEKALLGTRTHPYSLKTQYDLGLGWIIENTDNTEIIACMFLWSTPSPEWYEFGTGWTSPLHREKHLASQVFRLCTEYVREQEISAFLLTHHPRIIRLAELTQWCEATRDTWSQIPWKASCEPCDRWETNEEKLTCSFRATSDCRLFFITPPT